MLAYAANRPVAVDRRPHPNAMLFIIGAHVAVAAVVISAKMDLPVIPRERPLIVDSIKVPPVPPPNPTRNQTTPHTPTTISNPVKHLIIAPIDQPPVAPTNPTVDPGPPLGTGTAVIATVLRPVITSVRSGALLLTPPSELKPPYPASKLLNEEEATLTLKLTIGPSGRVVAVDPVGHTDPVFLAAARKHLIDRWRYKPATEDGTPVTSTTVITLRFELDG